MVNGRRDCAEDCAATRLEVLNRASSIRDLRASDFCMEASSFRTHSWSVRGPPLLPRQNPHETVEETLTRQSVRRNVRCNSDSDHTREERERGGNQDRREEARSTVDVDTPVTRCCSDHWLVAVVESHE